MCVKLVGKFKLFVRELINPRYHLQALEPVSHVKLSDMNSFKSKKSAPNLGAFFDSLFVLIGHSFDIFGYDSFLFCLFLEIFF